MKIKFLFITYLILALSTIATAQLNEDFQDIAEANTKAIENSTNYIGDNGFKFETFHTDINTQYSDIGIGFFREKFISFSARKIGALAKKDPITGEPFTKLYCSDINHDYNLNTPQLFSTILNRSDNLGTISFTNDGNTMYYTKSKETDTQSFTLYSADMNPDREGEWINMEPLSINGDYSIENPHVTKDGKWLYFASNRPEAIGGFDIFRIALKTNGDISVEDRFDGEVERIEGSVNTVLDEKFPQTSFDGKYLYFSSQGHNTQGGYDIFRARNAKSGFVSIRNLGNTINSTADDVAYIQATPTIGYMTSNRDGGKGGYDIYRIKETPVILSVSGQAIDKETRIAIEGVAIVLIDENGEEVATTHSDKNGEYEFDVDSYLNYTIIAYKDGFERGTNSINTSSTVSQNFKQDILLEPTPAEIVVEKDKTIIKIDNIQFDNNSAQIKPLSTITLNSIVATLDANPDISIKIEAHTDSKGSSTYNRALSMRRAASTMDYLLKKGISVDRMSSEGFGEDKLLINCSSCTQEQNEQNRRVEFVVITDD